MKNCKKIVVLMVLAILSTQAYCQEDDFFLKGENGVKTEESSTVTEDAFYLDDIATRNLMEDNQILEYKPLSEADILWEKRMWRIIDTREKMNQAFRNADKPLFNILKEMLENGDILGFKDESFKEDLNSNEIAGLLSKVDTITYHDPETYEEKIKIAKSDIDPNSITRFRVKEVWYFDKKTSTLGSRILGISPIVEEYDENTGEFKYERPLFWVYYPEARKHLSKYPVPNDFNDRTPISWYDLFEMRMFSSYIYKSSNSLGLRLKDLHPNSDYDVLLESDKIKSELFNLEHDLWSY